MDEIFGDEEMFFRKLIRNRRPDLSRDEEDEIIRDILENMDDDDPWFYTYDTLEPILDGLVFAFWSLEFGRGVDCVPVRLACAALSIKFPNSIISRVRFPLGSSSKH